MIFPKRFWSFVLVWVLLSALAFIAWDVSFALRAEENFHLTFAVCYALSDFVEVHSGRFPRDRTEFIAHNKSHQPKTINGPDFRSLDHARLERAEKGLSIPYGQSVCDTKQNSYDILQPSFEDQYRTSLFDPAFQELNETIKKWREKCPPSSSP